jgi:hypothetical protein
MTCLDIEYKYIMDFQKSVVKIEVVHNNFAIFDLSSTSISTMSLFKKIAIVGGSGDLGKYITAAILAEGQRFDLTLISRRSGGQLSLTGAKIIEVDDYIESEELTHALTGQDVLLSFHNTAAAPGGRVPALAKYLFDS